MTFLMAMDVLKNVADLLYGLVIFYFEFDLFFRNCIVAFEKVFVVHLSDIGFVHLVFYRFEILKYLYFVLLVWSFQEAFILNSSAH